MKYLIEYLPTALRHLWKRPSFTVTAVMALGIGIGLAAAIFAVVNSILISPLPFPDSRNLVMVWESSNAQPNPRGVLSPADFMDLQERNRSFTKMAAYAVARANLLPTPGFAEESDQVNAAHVTADFFSTLEIPPVAGRTFFPDEDRPDKAPAAVISERLWNRRYARNANIIGQTIDVSGKRHIVVGVVPSSFTYPARDVELWTIRTLVPPESRTVFYLRVVARLKPGTSMVQAQTDVGRIAPELEHANPGNYTHLLFSVVGLKESITGPIRPTLVLLQVAGVIVLLIAIINVANLLLIQGIVREKEIAVRVSLGARRGRIIGQLMTENVIMSVMSGAVGLVFAYWATSFLRALSPASLPRINELGINLPALLVTLGVSLSAPLIFGLYPALQCSRPDLSEVMRERAASGGQDRRRLLLKKILVGVQVATTFVLTVGGCLMFRSLIKLQQVALGFTAPPAEILALQVDPTHLPREQQLQFYQDLLQRVEALNGVEAATVTINVPPHRTRYMDNFQIPGINETTPYVPVSLCSKNFFKTLGIPLLQGRDFNDDDKYGGHPVAIISESVARRYFGNVNPFGRTLKQGDSTEPKNPYMEIVGVVGDVKFNGLRDTNALGLYTPFQQEHVPYWKTLLVRTKNPLSLVPTIRSIAQEMDKKTSLGHPETMEQIIAEDLQQSKMETSILLLFAILALILAAIGIYGLMLYSVVQEGKEIALRIAIGAQRWQIIYLIARRAFTLTCVGILAGCAVTLAATPLIRSFLYGVTANDPMTFVMMAIVVMVTGMTATLIPVLKAVKIDPVVVLKYE